MAYVFKAQGVEIAFGFKIGCYSIPHPALTNPKFLQKVRTMEDLV